MSREWQPSHHDLFTSAPLGAQLIYPTISPDGSIRVHTGINASTKLLKKGIIAQFPDHFPHQTPQTLSTVELDRFKNILYLRLGERYEMIHNTLTKYQAALYTH